MKKLILLLVASFALVAFANAQRVFSLTGDTVNGNETIYVDAVLESSTSSGTLTLQAAFSEIGGTSDGSAYLQGSLDGSSYVDILETTGLFHFYPNDTLTITNGAVMQAVVLNSPFIEYRWKVVGTASDSTFVTPKFTWKD